LDALTEAIVAGTELRKRLGGRELDGWFLIEHSDPECTDRFRFLRPLFHCLEDITAPSEPTREPKAESFTDRVTSAGRRESSKSMTQERFTMRHPSSGLDQIESFIREVSRHPRRTVEISKGYFTEKRFEAEPLCDSRTLAEIPQN